MRQSSDSRTRIYSLALGKQRIQRSGGHHMSPRGTIAPALFRVCSAELRLGGRSTRYSPLP